MTEVTSETVDVAATRLGPLAGLLVQRLTGRSSQPARYDLPPPRLDEHGEQPREWLTTHEGET